MGINLKVAGQGFPATLTIDTSKMKRRRTMNKVYVCGACGYEYDPAVGDPDNGIKPGTPFEELPEDWECPLCGLGKDVFKEKED